MNTNPLIVTIATVAFALTGATTVAGPLKRADVAGSPDWVLHVDFDALRPTAVGQFLQDEMKKPEAQAKLAAFQAVASFDLRTQLHGATLYGIGAAPENGVLVVYADFDPERLVTLAKAANDSQSTEHKNHVIYSWINENKHGRDKKSRIYAAIAGSRIIFGQREPAVAKALDVMDGAVPTLAAGNNFSQLGAVGNANIVEAVAGKMDLPDTDPHAALLRLSKQVRFQLSEAQSQMKATLTLDANDEEVAGHMTSVAQGLLALGKLQSSKPELIKLANALALNHDGPSLVVTLTLPAGDVLEMIKADAARKAAEKNR